MHTKRCRSYRPAASSAVATAFSLSMLWLDFKDDCSGDSWYVCHNACKHHNLLSTSTLLLDAVTLYKHCLIESPCNPAETHIQPVCSPCCWSWYPPNWSLFHCSICYKGVETCGTVPDGTMHCSLQGLAQHVLLLQKLAVCCRLVCCCCDNASGCSTYMDAAGDCLQDIQCQARMMQTKTVHDISCGSTELGLIWRCTHLQSCRYVFGRSHSVEYWQHRCITRVATDHCSALSLTSAYYMNHDGMLAQICHMTGLCCQPIQHH